MRAFLEGTDESFEDLLSAITRGSGGGVADEQALAGVAHAGTGATPLMAAAGQGQDGPGELGGRAGVAPAPGPGPWAPEAAGRQPTFWGGAGGGGAPPPAREIWHFQLIFLAFS